MIHSFQSLQQQKNINCFIQLYETLMKMATQYQYHILRKLEAVLWRRICKILHLLSSVCSFYKNLYIMSKESLNCSKITFIWGTIHPDKLWLFWSFLLVGSQKKNKLAMLGVGFFSGSMVWIPKLMRIQQNRAKFRCFNTPHFQGHVPHLGSIKVC